MIQVHTIQRPVVGTYIPGTDLLPHTEITVVYVTLRDQVALVLAKGQSLIPFGFVGPAKSVALPVPGPNIAVAIPLFGTFPTRVLLPGINDALSLVSTLIPPGNGDTGGSGSKPQSKAVVLNTRRQIVNKTLPSVRRGAICALKFMIHLLSDVCTNLTCGHIDTPDAVVSAITDVHESAVEDDSCWSIKPGLRKRAIDQPSFVCASVSRHISGRIDAPNAVVVGIGYIGVPIGGVVGNRCRIIEAGRTSIGIDVARLSIAGESRNVTRCINHANCIISHVGNDELA